MTDSGNTPQLQDLEPLDDGASTAGPAAATTSDQATLVALKAGMGPPAFNPSCRDKASYRLLMASIFMGLGCFMPFSADASLVGYKTMSGAIFMFIGLGMLWTWWGAIYNNRSSSASLKWLALTFVPFATQLMNLIAYDPQAALSLAQSANLLSSGADISAGWGELFSDMGTALGKEEASKTSAAAMRVENWFRCFGTGRIMLLLGAFLAEMFFIMGLVGGAKQNKQQKVARSKQAAERRRR